MFRSQRKTIDESDEADDESDIISYDSEISSDDDEIPHHHHHNHNNNNKNNNNNNESDIEIPNNENRIDINSPSQQTKKKPSYRDTLHKLTKTQHKLIQVPQKACNFTGSLIKYDKSPPEHSHPLLRRRKKKVVAKEVHVKDKSTGEYKKKVLITHKKHHHYQDFIPTKLNGISSKERWIQFIGLSEFLEKTFYIAGAMEFIGTCLFVYMSLSIVITSSNFYSKEIGVEGINSYKIFVTSGVLHFVLVFLLIIACAPASGAHINPTITISTMLSGYSSLSRSILYISCQIAGGIVGSSILRGVLGKEEMSKGLCTYGDSVSGVDVMGNEFMFAFLNLLVAFGTALDPRQRKVLGGVTGAILIAIALGLSIVIVGGLSKDIVFGFNIARCLSPSIILDNYHHLYPYIVGPILASVAIGVWNFMVPSFRFFSNLSNIEERQFPSLVEGSTFGTNENDKQDENN